MNQTSELGSLNHLLVQVCRLHHARAHSLFEKIGIYRGQPPLLLALEEQEGLTHSELAAHLHVTPATITKMLQRMGRAGLVERRPDPDDQRVSRAYLTDAGHEILNDVKQVIATEASETFDGFTPEERVLLRRFLLQIRENLMHVIDEK